jgi:hypothetical protein
MAGDPHAANRGVVVAVRGSVVDVRFDERLPPIYSLLRTGDGERIVIEVLAQPDASHVRGIALTGTQGLARGTAVRDTGGPLKAPVGKAIVSRMFDVFGNIIDRKAPLTDVEWRSVHRAPPSLAERAVKSQVFETGIKVIDVLMPLERGGKAGLFGGAGVGERLLPLDDDWRRKRAALPWPTKTLPEVMGDSTERLRLTLSCERRVACQREREPSRRHGSCREEHQGVTRESRGRLSSRAPGVHRRGVVRRRLRLRGVVERQGAWSGRRTEPHS